MYFHSSKTVFCLLARCCLKKFPDPKRFIFSVLLLFSLCSVELNVIFSSVAPPVVHSCNRVIHYFSSILCSIFSFTAIFFCIVWSKSFIFCVFLIIRIFFHFALYFAGLMLVFDGRVLRPCVYTKLFLLTFTA